MSGDRRCIHGVVSFAYCANCSTGRVYTHEVDDLRAQLAAATAERDEARAGLKREEENNLLNANAVSLFAAEAQTERAARQQAEADRDSLRQRLAETEAARDRFHAFSEMFSTWAEQADSRLRAAVPDDGSDHPLADLADDVSANLRAIYDGEDFKVLRIHRSLTEKLAAADVAVCAAERLWAYCQEHCGDWYLKSERRDIANSVDDALAAYRSKRGAR